jgi:hypothetical protein
LRLLTRAGAKLAVVVIGGGLLLTEAVLFFGEPYLPFFRHVYDRDLGFRMRPRPGQVNRLGFNDDEPRPKEGKTFRILCLGDSFNWMGGRTWNYTVLLRQKLDRRYRGTEVLNAGYPAQGPQQHAIVLERYWRELSPDLVVLGFFVGNDFIDNVPGMRQIVVNDVHYWVRPANLPHLFGQPLVADSRVRAVFGQAIAVNRARRRARRGGAGGPMSEEAFLDLERARLRPWTRAARVDGEYRRREGAAWAGLDSMRTFLAARGIPFVVAAFPDEIQVSPALLAQVVARFGLAASDIDLELPQWQLEEYTRRHGLPYIDMLPRFRAEARQRALYLKHDSHWNREGNALAADVLAEGLTPLLDEHVERR